MSQTHYFFEPHDVPIREVAEWEYLLKQITDKELDWIAYATSNRMMLVISDAINGAWNVHVVHNLVGLGSVERITEIQQLKKLALLKYISK